MPLGLVSSVQSAPDEDNSECLIVLSEQTHQGLGAVEKSASTDSPCHQHGRQGKTNQHFEQIWGGRWGDGDQCSACFIYIYIYLGEGNGTPLQYCGPELPWMEEPGRLQSMGSLRVGHD